MPSAAMHACLGREGKARYENGGVYVGEFRREQRCGWGRHSFPGGDVYEGEWLADRIHGARVPSVHCCFQRPCDGHACCPGYCKASSVLRPAPWSQHAILISLPKRQYFRLATAGQGRCTYTDGSYYEGHWAAGERVKGTLVSADGSAEYTGDWRGNARHGQGVQFHKGLYKYTGGRAQPPPVASVDAHAASELNSLMTPRPCLYVQWWIPCEGFSGVF